MLDVAPERRNYTLFRDDDGHTPDWQQYRLSIQETKCYHLATVLHSLPSGLSEKCFVASYLP